MCYVGTNGAAQQMQSRPALGCSTTAENINMDVKNSRCIACLYNNSFVEVWGCRGMEKSVMHAVNHIWFSCLQHEPWDSLRSLHVEIMVQEMSELLLIQALCYVQLGTVTH
jgi:hypothetical protein